MSPSFSNCLNFSIIFLPIPFFPSICSTEVMSSVASMTDSAAFKYALALNGSPRDFSICDNSSRRPTRVSFRRFCATVTNSFFGDFFRVPLPCGFAL